MTLCFCFMIAAIMRKLNLHPELYKDEETLPKALRYALCAGIIAQWSIGSTKGLPTESASQNLTEQLIDQFLCSLLAMTSMQEDLRSIFCNELHSIRWKYEASISNGHGLCILYKMPPHTHNDVFILFKQVFLSLRIEG